MVKVCRLYVGILAALALCKYCLAEWNTTHKSANQTVSNCNLHGDRDNCTETDPWNEHFSKCPEELMYYCIHGECRYIKEQNAPSCRCQSQYMGARCEYVSLDWQIGERQRIIIGSVVAGLIVLMALIVSVCIYSHRRRGLCWGRRRQREEPRNGTEKIGMMDTSTRHTDSV
ncbi:transcript variant X1 [Nothobranchius furzeri]|uniref:Transcript variant X1 n=2 Tax=Nothobranchius furzeri TaxID=105023 RepID=A0A9D3B9N1_NOTFU|nr:probetacellulin isoform X2 [Nothobranchius furzeri]KAF7199300.1 transcript variant X1 [Nothobranchius furzeri]